MTAWQVEGRNYSRIVPELADWERRSILLTRIPFYQVDMMQRAQNVARLARWPREPHRAPGLPEAATGMPSRQGERQGGATPAIRHKPLGSQRAQLLAAAASLVWFAGWFQAIYDEIAGHHRNNDRD
jgi:hypothetical protein